MTTTTQTTIPLSTKSSALASNVYFKINTLNEFCFIHCQFTCDIYSNYYLETFNKLMIKITVKRCITYTNYPHLKKRGQSQLWTYLQKSSVSYENVLKMMVMTAAKMFRSKVRAIVSSKYGNTTFKITRMNKNQC